MEMTYINLAFKDKIKGPLPLFAFGNCLIEDSFQSAIDFMIRENDDRTELCILFPPLPPPPQNELF